jgi:holo-[acyl-carrier protein] synthase
MARLASAHPEGMGTIFTDDELRYCRGKRRAYEHMAARFAAKEAVLKALGSGLGQRMRWTDVEIAMGVLGRPRVLLHGEVADWARGRGLVQIDVSLSHTADLAVAHAISVWRVPANAI